MADLRGVRGALGASHVFFRTYLYESVPVDFLFKPVLSHVALCILVAGYSCSSRASHSCYRG